MNAGPSPEEGAPQNAEQPVGDRSVVVRGDNQGIVSTGDYAFNVVYTEGGFVQTPSVMELPLHEPPELPVSSRMELFGREALVEQVAQQLVAGRSVQLHGRPGVGRKAVAWAVHRRLADSGGRGHVLLPRAGESDTLAGTYERLAGVFFGRNFLRGVDESMLRAAVAGVTTHITLVDCTLNTESLSRVMDTFSGCTFLITSEFRTLPDPESVHHVQPLTRAAAADLLSAELGLRLGPIGLQNLQFDHAYRLAEGRPQRLRLFAEFIKNSDQWRARSTEEPFDQPAPTDPDLVDPRKQAEVLAAAISEQARRVLVALRTTGAPLAPAWFAAVTGDPQAAEAGHELYDRRLVTRDDAGYQITDDAAAAIDTLGLGRTDAKTAAEGVLALIATPHAPTADPHMLLSIARGLEGAREWATASRFDKMAAPVALAAGHGQVALQLYVLGKKAAGLAGMAGDIEYYTRTEHQMRQLLQGDVIAAATAIAALSEGAIHAAPAAAHGLSHIGKGIRATRWGNRLLHGKALIATVTAATVVVGGTAVAVIVATTGPSASAYSHFPAGCDHLLDIELKTGEIQSDWIDEDTAGHGSSPIRDLLSQVHDLDQSSLTAATDPQIKDAFRAHQSDARAFATAYDAGAVYEHDYDTASGAAALKAEGDMTNDQSRLVSLCNVAISPDGHASTLPNPLASNS
ncbi:hypothetical protein ACFXJ5_33695 [Streptomyces sp. NPDC059373]